MRAKLFTRRFTAAASIMSMCLCMAIVSAVADNTIVSSRSGAVASLSTAAQATCRPHDVQTAEWDASTTFEQAKQSHTPRARHVPPHLTGHEERKDAGNRLIVVRATPDGPAKKPSRRTAQRRGKRRRARKLDACAFYITFADDPGTGNYDGVLGAADDTWNFVPVGTRKVTGLKRSDGTTDDVELTVSDNDGGWGITGHKGIYHGYIYHNCRCVDLTATFRYLPAGIYEVLVYAHGDAPDQNAAIEISCGDVTSHGRKTLCDGSNRYRDTQFEQGNQYVRYVVDVADGSDLIITSRRDGSSYSMLNAIQLRRLLPQADWQTQKRRAGR